MGVCKITDTYTETARTSRSAPMHESDMRLLHQGLVVSLITNEARKV